MMLLCTLLEVILGCRQGIKILLKFNMSIYAKTDIQNKILILLLPISMRDMLK